MAVVGDAYVYVRAITTNVLPDIQKGLSGINNIGQIAGRDLGNSINRGFKAGNFEQGFDSLSDRLEASRLEFRRLNNAARFLGPTFAGVGGAIGALVGGLVVLVAAAGSAARSLVVLPAALFSLVQALGTTRFLLGGVGAAVQALAQRQQAGAASTRAEEAALRRVIDARLALKRLIEEEAPEALEAARERAAEAARAAADSLLSAERTQRSYNESQRDSLGAIEDLNEARDAAREKLQQLRFELEGAAISEARARLEFEKARDSLQAVQDLPPNSRARQEAELAFAQAELNLRKAIDGNSDLKREEDRASRAGVEGSEDVLAAKERLAAAQEREADLAIDTARAFERAARAQTEAAQAAADAAAGGSVERDLNRRIAEARQALRDAEDDAAEARRGANSALADAYADLNDAGITLAETIERLRLKFKALRLQISTPILTLFNEALLILEANFMEFAPILEETGRIVGQLALDFAEAFLQGEGLGRLKSVLTTNNVLLENLGEAGLNLAQAFLVILDAAEPLITAFGEWAASRSADFLKELTKDGNTLGETLANAERNFKNFATLIGNIFSGFGIIGSVINEEGGAADTLLGGLISRSEGWLAGLTADAESGELNTFFQNISTNALALFDVIAELGDVLLELGAQEGLKPFLDSIRNAIDIFGQIGVELLKPDGAAAGLGTFVENFALLIQNVTESGAIETFFQTLNDIIEEVNGFLQNDTVQAFLERLGPVVAQFAAFGLAFRAVRFVVEAVLGTVLLILSPVLVLAGYLMRLNGETGFKGFVTNLGKAFGIVSRVLGIVGLIVSIIALAYQNSEQFREAVAGAVAGIINVFTNAFNDIREIFEGGNGFGPRTLEVFSQLGDAVRGIFKFIGDLIGTFISVATLAIGIVVGAISGAVQAIGPFIEAIIAGFQGIGDVFRGIVLLLKGDWGGAMEFFKSGIKNFADFFKNIWEGLVRIFKGIVNGFIDAWNGLATKIKFRFPQFLGGGEFSLRPIPRLAEGGVVMPSSRGTLALIGEAGRPERVEPLDPQGLSKRDRAIIDQLSGGGIGGATINVYPSPGMDERELAEMVSRKLAYQMRKGSV